MNYDQLDDENYGYSFSDPWENRESKLFKFAILSIIAASAVFFALLSFTVLHTFLTDNHQAQIEKILALPELNVYSVEKEQPSIEPTIPIEVAEAKPLVLPTEDIEPSFKQSLEPIWQKHTVKSGETLSTIFSHNGIKQADLISIVHLPAGKKLFDGLKPKQKIAFQVDDNHHLLGLKYYKSSIDTFVISLKEGKYQINDEKTPIETRMVKAAGAIENSLARAAKKNNIPNKIVMELAEIFSWQINFKKDIQKGDTFSLLYEKSYADENLIRVDDIVAAEFITHGHHYQAIRYQDSNGLSSYYTPEGESLENAFLRTPLKYSRISSPFNPTRMHPILKKPRPHYGVDFAAPAGTPIRATGDGRVNFVGQQGGYGNVVSITHNHSITTVYAHMRKFAPKTYKGKRVKKGDIIGYVGSTGLATGPHLHYEYRIKNKAVNPLKVSLPKGSPIPEIKLAQFQQTAQQLIAELDGQAPTRLAEN